MALFENGWGSVRPVWREGVMCLFSASIEIAIILKLTFQIFRFTWIDNDGKSVEMILKSRHCLIVSHFWSLRYEEKWSHF